MSSNIYEVYLQNPQTSCEDKFPILYGKCEESPFKELRLWFVHISNDLWEQSWNGDWKMPFPMADYTFLVEEKYASKSLINELRTDPIKWKSVAKQMLLGDWCPRYELLWKDVPVYIHKNDSGIKYGYCRTQSSKSPERELWYVSFRDHSTFIVDKVCIAEDFIDRMGWDMAKWTKICWCRLEDEVEWEKLGTGSLEGGYVRTHKFVLDSPYIPDLIEEIEECISQYEKDNPSH
jgi:hypothetical protein